jgi:hypothetical protein
VRVLINDTLGVMAAGRYMNPDAMIGIILGTGAPLCCQGTNLPARRERPEKCLLHWLDYP